MNALLKREVLLVFIAALGMMLNQFSLLNLLPLYIVDTGGTEFLAGLQNSIFSISAVIFRFILGPMADSKGRKTLLLIGSFVFATAPIAIWLSPNYPLQLLSRVYHSIGLATFLSSASSQIADHTPYEYRGRIIGLYRALISFTLMIGPAFGLKIIDAKGFDELFIISSIICFISFFAIACLPKDKIVDESMNVKEILINTKELLKNPILVTAYLGIGVVSLSAGALMSYLTMYALDTGVVDNPGIYFTIYAGIGIFATGLSGYLSDKFGREKVIWPSIALLGLGICGLTFLSQYGNIIFYLSALLSGTGYSSALAVLITWVIDNADKKARATALVNQENSIDLAMAIGPFLIGIGTMVFELSTLFLLLGVSTTVSAYGLYSRSRHRN